MTPAVRAQYLEQLGVMAYVPRLVGAKHLSPSSLVFLLQAENLDWESPPHQLLKKIIDAVGLPEEAIAICFSPTIPIAIPAVNKTAKIIAFGSGLSETVTSNTFTTLPLTELPHHDAAKRALWQELKAIKAAYGH